MTTTDLLRNFRSALVALVPAMDRIAIPWRRPSAYDEWDAIATALYETFVVGVIRWSLPEEERETFALPHYDLLDFEDRTCSWIEVEHDALGPGSWVFHAFGTRVEPFDSVEVRLVSTDGERPENRVVECSVLGAVFTLRLRLTRDRERRIEAFPVVEGGQDRSG